jgi:hypothetical protein
VSEPEEHLKLSMTDRLLNCYQQMILLRTA